MDFAYIAKNGISYRVNAFMKVGKVAVVMRKINAEARALESLMYEDIATSLRNNILARKTGLFLVTGPTGSGKSTSLVAMLEHLNHTVNAHMITIEDPIEFVFKPDKWVSPLINSIDNKPLWQGFASFFVPGKSELYPFDAATIASYQGQLQQNPNY